MRCFVARLAQAGTFVKKRYTKLRYPEISAIIVWSRFDNKNQRLEPIWVTSEGLGTHECVNSKLDVEILWKWKK